MISTRTAMRVYDGRPRVSVTPYADTGQVCLCFSNDKKDGHVELWAEPGVLLDALEDAISQITELVVAKDRS